MPFDKKSLLFGMLLCWASRSAFAHDFWLQPTQYWTDPGAVTSLTLQVGHGPDRQRSPIPTSRISRFEMNAPAGTILDLHARLRLGGVLDDADFLVQGPGTYVLVLQTDDRAQTHLPAVRFNDYLKAEGLTPALEQRARLKRADADGSERYSRSAKAILQVGPPAAGSQDRLARPLGLLLEIVPEASPYAVPRSSSLPVRVLYAGRPLLGALVKLTDLKNDASPLEVQLTDKDGRAVFSMPSTGLWLLNVIWTKALPRSEDTDFETVFSSLSFGFPTGNAKPLK
jgi:uncharacterized GH25 family protein